MYIVLARRISCRARATRRVVATKRSDSLRILISSSTKFWVSGMRDFSRSSRTFSRCSLYILFINFWVKFSARNDRGHTLRHDMQCASWVESRRYRSVHDAHALNSGQYAQTIRERVDLLNGSQQVPHSFIILRGVLFFNLGFDHLDTVLRNLDRDGQVILVGHVGP